MGGLEDIIVPTRWKMKITAASSQCSSFRASRPPWISSEAMTRKS